MNKKTLKAQIGKPVRLHWRDPQTRPGWTDKPLEDKTARAWTLGVIQGFNSDGELVIACSGSNEDVGDRTTIPLADVLELEPLKIGRSVS